MPYLFLTDSTGKKKTEREKGRQKPKERQNRESKGLNRNGKIRKCKTPLNDARHVSPDEKDDREKKKEIRLIIIAGGFSALLLLLLPLAAAATQNPTHSPTLSRPHAEPERQLVGACLDVFAETAPARLACFLFSHEVCAD